VDVSKKSPKGDVVIIKGDFLSTNLAKSLVDLIVAEPPYRSPYDEYLKFTEAWLRKALETVKPDSRMCVILPFDLNEGEDVKNIYADTVAIAKRVGWKYFTTILWYANTNQKSTAEDVVNVGTLKINMPVKAIAVMYKSVWRKLRDGVSDIERHEFIAWTNGLWNIPHEVSSGGPTQLPAELIKRCIKLFTYVGSIVLDPFFVFDTTCVVASMLRRRCIGIELQKQNSQ